MHGTEEESVLDGLHHSHPDHARVSAAWFLTSHVQTSVPLSEGPETVEEIRICHPKIGHSAGRIVYF